MEENIYEALEMADSNAEGTQQPGKVEVVIDYNIEKILVIIANSILVCGLLAVFICIFCLVFQNRISPYGTDIVFNPGGFAITLTILFSTLMSWGLMKVLVNISLTLKKINAKLS